MYRSILMRISTAVMWTAVLLCLLMAGAMGIARHQGLEVLSVQSDSMAPVINTGDAVLADTTERIPMPGDIVTYQSPQHHGVLLTHRVISVDAKRRTFVARGDNAGAADPEAPMRSIVGEVRHGLPYAGYALDFFRRPIGLALMVYVPAAGIVLFEIRRLSRHFGGPGPDHYVHHQFYQP